MHIFNKNVSQLIATILSFHLEEIPGNSVLKGSEYNSLLRTPGRRLAQGHVLTRVLTSEDMTGGPQIGGHCAG